MNDSNAVVLRRLRWQCRRGLLELDILFLRFLEQRYPALSAAQQGCFRGLLDQSDQTLLAWLHGQQEPPSELKLIIHNIYN